MKKIFLGLTAGLILGIASSALAIVIQGAPKVFTDVNAEAYYFPHLNKMSAAGVVSGYEDGRFGPDDGVTRAQVVTMLNQYADKVVAKKLEQKLSGVLPILKNLTLEQSPRLLYIDAITVANAGLYKLPNVPDLFEYKVDVNAGLDSTWEVYYRPKDGVTDIPYYLHFKGGMVDGVNMPEAWYGRFLSGYSAQIL